MKNSQIQNIVIHMLDDSADNSLSDKINEFHMQVIARRLSKSNLTANQKITIIDRIIKNLN